MRDNKQIKIRVKNTITICLVALALIGCKKDIDTSTPLPIAMTVSKILVKGPSEKENGDSWDSNGGRPDLQVLIDKEDSDFTSSFLTEIYEDCFLDSTDYIFDVNWRIEDISQNHVIGLFDDDDPDKDDYLGGFIFTPTSYYTFGKKTIEIIGDAPVYFELSIDWHF